MVQNRATSFFFRADAREVPRIRHFLARWLRDSNVPQPAHADLVLAASEAINNACQHGPGGRLQVTCASSGEDVSVSVTDEGAGFVVHEEGTQTPPTDTTGGRGMFLMRRLADEVKVRTTIRGTTVILTRHVG